MRLQYKDVLYHWDLAGLNLSRSQAGMMKAIQGERGYPDLQIFGVGGRCLFLEVKAVTPYLKDGKTLKADEHLREQQAYHLLLQERGHIAVFATGFDECKELVDTFLQQKEMIKVEYKSKTGICMAHPPLNKKDVKNEDGRVVGHILNFAMEDTCPDCGKLWSEHE